MLISLIGIILKKRYCIVEKIGQGGNGQLYLARDLELGAVWAVKEIPLVNKKEAKLLRLLEHPALPKMIDYAERDEFCYLVMEYVRGKSLGTWIKEGKQFSLEDILRIGIEVSQVLSYLHTRKPVVIYGDLKPDNLMMTEDGRLYLVDFGSAALGYKEEQRICSGTAEFAAPEQYEGKMTVVSDVYALGRTLRFLCGEKWWKYVLRFPAFGVFVMKCCQRDAKKRFSDMSVVMGRLNRLLQAQQRVKRSPAVEMALALCVCIFGICGGLLYERNEVDFYTALTQVTELYYGENIERNSGNKTRHVCSQVEKRLQKMLKIYKTEFEQCRLLLLLAYNGEFMGEPERAGLYYEQLLLYQPETLDGYVEYGLFLLRQGETEKSKRLWEEYQNMEKQNESWNQEANGNMMYWESEVKNGEDGKSPA